ncbi:phospholipase D family protein [Candidatus Bathyarchaeota archaeon]|nr:phospholipase D family protein [Candidatus Bathyarchaeota archaeon]
MVKRSLFLILALGLAIGFLAGHIYQKSAFDELTQQIAVLERRNQDLNKWLQGNISLYEERIAILKDEAKRIANEAASLRSRLKTLQSQANTTVLGIYFSPKGGCEAQIIWWINRANISIHVLIYSFTLDSISNALINAYNRGVDVKIVFERDQVTKYSEYQKLKAAGVPVRNDTNPGLMHNKVMIIDGKIVLTGSFNWSVSAERRNNENLIVIRSIYVARVYEEEFDKIWNNSI